MWMFVFLSLSFSGFVACLAIVQVLCGLTHHVLDLHRLDEIVHVVHDLVLPRDVLHLNLVFVRTCRRVFLCVGVSHREAAILCGTSCALVVSGIRIVSRLCLHRIHSLFFGLELRLVLLVLVSWIL